MCICFCDDIPEFGCIYPDGFGAFNEGFDAAACSSYGGTPCEEVSGDVSGCTDSNASNYNAMATVDDGSCEYTEATSYCAELVSHFNIEAETLSEIILTISNIDENNVLVTTVSANNDPIDVFYLGGQIDLLK